MPIFALVGWLLFMSRVRLSSLYVLKSLESRMSQINAYVQCLISMQELFMSPRMMHMMPIIMLLNLFIRFRSLVTSIWIGRSNLESSGSLQKIF
jgi:hypothetical protein